MIIGHNPGCEMLLESLTGNLQVMPTASAALIREEGDSWNLIDFIRPKDFI
jgi:phosphohistidine phosphatase SixA